MEIKLKENDEFMKYEIDQCQKNVIIQKHSFKIITEKWGGAGVNIQTIKNAEYFPLSQMLNHPKTIELLPDPDFDHYEEKSESIPADDPGPFEEDSD